MSTFYVLPPRPLLDDHIARALAAFFPALPDADRIGRELADRLVDDVTRSDDVFVVHREELPDGEPLAGVLCEAFGAEAGDRVIEVRPGARPNEARVWLVGAAESP
jgi:hypothetical protein